MATSFEFQVGEGKSVMDRDDDDDDELLADQPKKRKKKKKKSAAMEEWEHLELTIDKDVDSASVYLMHLAMKCRASSDMQFVTVDIHVVEQRSVGDLKTGESSARPYIMIRLENALIGGWSMGGQEKDRPTESITIWYDRAAMKYIAFPVGQPMQVHGPLGWDQYEGNWKSDVLMKN